LENTPKINAKAYTMIVNEEALNEWLDKQLKIGLIVESGSTLCFYILKKNGSP